MTEIIQNIERQENIAGIKAAANNQQDNGNLWMLLTMLLLDTVNTQNDLSTIRAKSQQVSLDKQDELNKQFDQIDIKAPGASCWGQVPITTQVETYVYNADGKYWQIVKKTIVVGYRSQIVDQNKYDVAIQLQNQQLNLRQGLQQKMTYCQMSSSQTSTGADNAIKCSSQSIGVFVAMSDVLMAITDKIVNKRG